MSANSKSIYRLEGPPLIWGDYSHILIAGMTAHLDRHDGLLQLERTGPFVPPVSFPGIGDIVVTDDFKLLLQNSGLTGFTFRTVIKRRIVFLEWEKWDKTANEPAEYPSTGEPEDFVLERPHSLELAYQIGDIWEVCLTEYSKLKEAQTDWFRRRDRLYGYVSAQARIWFEQEVPQWVSFRRVHTR